MGPDENSSYMFGDDVKSIHLSTDRVYQLDSRFDRFTTLADEPTNLWGKVPDDYWEWRDFSRYSRSAPDPRALFEDYKEEDKPVMNWSKTVDYAGQYKDEYLTVSCDNEKDLAQDRILKTISIMKSNMMMKCLPYKIDRIECRMTPLIRHNIMQACRRLERYGKKIPFVACYDEYGRRIDDTVTLDTLRGVLIKIVEPNKHGELFLEFEGVLRDVDNKRQQRY